MCTVSFVCSNDKVIITSNRDEKIIRPGAVPPKNYTVNGKNIIYPKDSKAGGTWYVVDEKGTVLVLLNGADKKHLVKLPYRKSRGLIVIEMIGSASPKDFWNGINLENIEPFTLVLFQDKQLFQLRWDGTEKSTVDLEIDKNYIWSSSTLYSKEIREQRSSWFYTFLDSNPEITESKMLHFHRYTEAENDQDGLVINRNGEMKTLSITQSVIEKNKVIIHHFDLITEKEYSKTFISI
ncbi:NRDE family protein [Flavobacterium aquicola]|uniref:Transport and Golgi organization protein 2 n=1 Tax=Flavobacterium aquicola TaxID=1682742 RepID=A0A3E0EK63_9FLAO|nr:NRDE family protein [Flavobacterium aquicola]REG98133.1 transport and Golgi organization protein 2 [Flavobacterium aquicola]